MIKTDKIRKPQPVLLYIIDYLWSGFTGLSVAMMVVAFVGFGAVRYLVNLSACSRGCFSKSLGAALTIFQQNEIGISLWRSVVGITIALVAGLAAGLIAGSFKNRYGITQTRHYDFVSHAANHFGL